MGHKLTTSRSSLFSVSSAFTSPSRRYAATSTFYPGALSLLLSLSLAFSKGGGRVFCVLSLSILLGIYMQIVYSATPLLFACLRCILHVRLCCGALCFYVLCCACFRICLPLPASSLLACSCLTMTVGGNTLVFYTIIKGLYVRGGGYSCVSIACFLSYNFAMFFTMYC